MDPATASRPQPDQPDARGFAPRTNGRGVADLLKSLRDESTVLLRQEVALAKAELSEKAAKAGRNAAYLAAGALVAYLGLIFVLLAVTAGLTGGLAAAGVPTRHAVWIAPLIVGVVIAAIGVALVLTAIRTLKNTDQLVPHKTMDSLRENAQWARHKLM